MPGRPARRRHFLCAPGWRALAPVVHAIRPRRPAQTDDPFRVAAACGVRRTTLHRPWRRTPTRAKPAPSTHAPPERADVGIAPALDGGPPPPVLQPADRTRPAANPPRLARPARLAIASGPTPKRRLRRRPPC